MTADEASSGRCPTPDDLAALLDDRLEPPLRDRLELHLGICPECQRRVLSAAGETSWPSVAVNTSGATGKSEFVEPRPTFLERLREVVRRQVGSTPCPSPWNADTAESTSASFIPAIRGIEILDEIGRGAMGTVYRARQIGLNRIVAIKVLWVGPGHAIDSVTRLAKGPRTIARLEHPHIIQIFQVGKQDGWFFGVLEYLDGGDLKTALRDGPWPPTRGAALVRTLAETVHFMHVRGVVHCDLKSSNILLSAQGVPKIADFGLVRLFEDEEGFLNEPGAVLGTPSYMPPEQATGTGSAIGPASDIYSLGAILYELLVGHPPFLGSTREETLKQVVEAIPDSPSRLRSEVPRALDAICLRCLEKDPRLRYSDARELAADLSRYLERVDGSLARIEEYQPQLSEDYGLCVMRQQEAEQALARAEAAVEEAERTLYLRRLSLAEMEWERGDLAAARTVLIACVPKPGRPDYRKLQWNELWSRCQNE